MSGLLERGLALSRRERGNTLFSIATILAQHPHGPLSCGMFLRAIPYKDKMEGTAMKIRGLLAITAAIALSTTVMPAQPGTVNSASLPAGGHPGSRERQYQDCIPSGLSVPAPLVSNT